MSIVDDRQFAANLCMSSEMTAYPSPYLRKRNEREGEREREREKEKTNKNNSLDFKLLIFIILLSET